MKVKWTNKVRNTVILDRIRPECSLEGRAMKLKLTYFGHCMRRTQSLEKDLMLGMVDGSRRQGRRRRRWQDEIITMTNLTWTEIINKTQDRVEWKKLVREKTRSRKRHFE